MRRRTLGIACALAAFALDQGTKEVALNSPALALGVEILPVLNLVLLHNRGVSFGMLSELVPWWALTVLALTIVILLSVWLWKTERRIVCAALGLMIGGAIGNIVDRLRHGGVTDFLDFHIAGYHWPAFNFADITVVCGAALLLLDNIYEAKQSRNSDK